MLYALKIKFLPSLFSAIPALYLENSLYLSQTVYLLESDSELSLQRVEHCTFAIIAGSTFSWFFCLKKIGVVIERNQSRSELNLIAIQYASVDILNLLLFISRLTIKEISTLSNQNLFSAYLVCWTITWVLLKI